MGEIKSPVDSVWPSVERIVLDKFLVGSSASVSKESLECLRAVHRDISLSQAEVSSYPSKVMDHMVYNLRTWLLKSHHSETRTLTVRTPKTWLDHLKHDMLASGCRFLVFAASKFSPPEYVEESKQVETLIRVCPHNDSYFSESREHIEFLSWKLE